MTSRRRTWPCRLAALTNVPAHVAGGVRCGHPDLPRSALWTVADLLADERRAYFPGLHVPTGQVPDVGIPTAPGRSVTEQNPVAVPQQRRDDTSLRGAFRGDRHRRIVPPVVSDTVPCRVPRCVPDRTESSGNHRQLAGLCHCARPAIRHVRRPANDFCKQGVVHPTCTSERRMTARNG